MDVEGLLRSLRESKVRFVVIGATAFPVHGYSRATLDTDIFIEPTPRNARLARQALIAFGYDLADISIEDLLENKILIRQYLELIPKPLPAAIGCKVRGSALSAKKVLDVLQRL